MALNEKEINALVKRARKMVRSSLALMFLVIFVMIYSTMGLDFFSFEDPDEQLALAPIDIGLIEDGIHVRTGLIDAEGMGLVIANCTNCHSAKLVTQNRMNTERWNETIKWMQETQNLWDLGDNQELIVKYLVTNYPPKKSGNRRTNLTNIEWYEMEN